MCPQRPHWLVEEQIGEPEARVYGGKYYSKGSDKCYSSIEKKGTGRLWIASQMPFEPGVEE